MDKERDICLWEFLWPRTENYVRHLYQISWVIIQSHGDLKMQRRLYVKKERDLFVKKNYPVYAPGSSNLSALIYIEGFGSPGKGHIESGNQPQVRIYVI